MFFEASDENLIADHSKDYMKNGDTQESAHVVPSTSALDAARKTPQQDFIPVSCCGRLPRDG
jgi:hypothetical protein